SQLRMCIEEMSELTKELCKYMRILRDEGIDNQEEKLLKVKENIVEEAADVLNCVSQIALIFGKDDVDKVRKFKIERASKYFDKQ
ncbi:MAG: hypothetical protein J6A51_03335, partial [Clostridia bacterium]|nr:hypothetical protein [Clostridia bacterium]